MNQAIPQPHQHIQAIIDNLLAAQRHNQEHLDVLTERIKALEGKGAQPKGKKAKPRLYLVK